MLTLVAILLALLIVPSPWGVVLVAVAATVDVLETVVMLRWTRRRPPAVGIECLVGRAGVATTRIAPTGRIRLDGELWSVRCEGPDPIDPGTAVVVDAVEQPLLVVRRRDSHRLPEWRASS